MGMQKEISEVTGFDSGEQFESAEQVWAYFSRENLCDCLRCSPSDCEELPPQETLDEWADMVIEHRWHCKKVATFLE